MYTSASLMYPAVPPGSVVFVSHRSAYRPGELVEVRITTARVVLRVAEVSGSGVLYLEATNVDGAPDYYVAPVRRAEIVGAVVLYVPYLGFPELFFRNPAYAFSWFWTEAGIGGAFVIGGLWAAATLASIWWRRRRVRRVPPRRRRLHLAA